MVKCNQWISMQEEDHSYPCNKPAAHFYVPKDPAFSRNIVALCPKHYDAKWNYGNHFEKVSLEEYFIFVIMTS